MLAIVREAAVEVFQVEASVVTEEASFEKDLNADSLDVVEFVMALEERFDIDMAEEELEGIETIGQAVDLIVRKLEESSAEPLA
ncbi:MAG TPA: acyl carrier protein [Candidatus Saccharimonadales bacterium]|nr:acyl carrier protein [Candidatus Saccharimonadales bacterium]